MRHAHPLIEAPDLSKEKGNDSPALMTVIFAMTYFFLSFFNVWANLARWPSFPGFFAAAANFPAGISFPFLAPSEARNAPGFLMAFLIFSFGCFAVVAMIQPLFPNSGATLVFGSDSFLESQPSIPIKNMEAIINIKRIFFIF